MYCKNDFKYYLKDRMSYKFRILQDASQTLTSIFNSKILSIKYDSIPCSSVRIDILDEKIEEIQDIINNVKSRNRFEGKNYTNGNY